MPTLLHLREKAIVYAMRCLLETLKLLFKNRAASLCTFAQLSVFSTCTKQAQMVCKANYGLHRFISEVIDIKRQVNGKKIKICR